MLTKTMLIMGLKKFSSKTLVNTQRAFLATKIRPNMKTLKNQQQVKPEIVVHKIKMELLEKHNLKEHTAAYDPFDLNVLDKMTIEQRDKINRFDQPVFAQILVDTFTRFEEAFADLK